MTPPSRTKIGNRKIHGRVKDRGQQLTETGTRYPDTNLTISYSVKGQPDAP
jgi:hypothetical protein